jgi:hypothetical protein
MRHFFDFFWATAEIIVPLTQDHQISLGSFFIAQEKPTNSQ